MTAGAGAAAALPRPVADPEEQLTGAELRRLTARVQAHNQPVSAGRVLLDVWEVLITAALVVGNVWIFAAPLREYLSSGRIEVAGVSPGLVEAIVLAVVVLAGAGLAVRLGPAGTSHAGVRWWVPSAADRPGLVSPSVLRAVLVGVGAGLAAGVLAAVLGGLSLLAGLPVAATGAACGLLVVGGSGALQVRAPGAVRRAARVADVALLLVPLAGLAVATWAPAVTAWSVPWWVPALVAAAGAAAVAVWVRGLDGLRAGDLRAWASTSLLLHEAVLSTDAGRLGRALGGGARVRGAAGRLTGAARGPVSALLAGEVLLLLRGGRAPVVVLAALAGGLFLVRVPVLAGGLGLWILLLLASDLAAQTAAAGAKAAGENPRLDGLVPLGGRAVRLTRGVLPALGALVVLLAVTATAAAELLPLVPAAAVVLGAGAVRAAYRGPVRWDMPVIATPAGAIPTGQVLHALRGGDVTLLGTLPLAWAALVGVSPGVVAAQCAAAVLAVLVASRVPRR